MRPKREVTWALKKSKSSMMHSWLNKLCTRLIQIRFVIECSKHDFFFSEFSILEAKDSAIRSYGWKSIISAKDVIRKGMVWCFGTGSSIWIKDRWLPVKSGSSS